ncbi:hypothetical protein EWQ83_29800 [Klebsiella pneumoniae]|uniref:hypothetical protein n=1 Tax=Klebsiella pneumoniae TaxID=573 RepID=UPI0010AB2168|nr:hypothetical protein [Klebsiella pneumoniae]TIH80283.1 hypothetical protein EWQ83_29800 [Klebsiella pneumoniae]TIH81667.1 hypothetical protein EWP92_28580 [Klebsiella pneumoniae]
MFAGKKSAQIREILISESAWEEMTCLFAPSLAIKLGLVGFNKALQLRAMNLFYLIYTLNKPAEKRNYFMKQQKAILESVKKWFAIV